MNNYVITIEGESMKLNYSEVIATQAIRITELEAQLEVAAKKDAAWIPVAWIRFCSDGSFEGPVANRFMEDVRKQSGAWSPLYTHPPLPLKMLDDGYIVELLRVAQKGFNNSTAYQLIQQAFCAKNNLKLEKL